MSLLDPTLEYSITIGQQYIVGISLFEGAFGPDFHRSIWKDAVYEYDYLSNCGWFHRSAIVQGIKEIPVECLHSAQPYRYIKNFIRSLARSKFEWAAKFEPKQSQVSVRLGQPITLIIKVKDMGERHWRSYMRISLIPYGERDPF